MSGGHFDYDQYRIRNIRESIEHIIEKNNVPLTEEDRADKWDTRVVHFDYPDEIIEEFKKGAEALRVAEIYAQRIDWYISGDDGEETFFIRLKEDLNAK